MRFSIFDCLGSSSAHRAAIPGHSVQHYPQEPQQAQVQGHGQVSPWHAGQERQLRHHGRRNGHAAHPRLLCWTGSQGSGGETSHLSHHGQDGQGNGL